MTPQWDGYACEVRRGGSRRQEREVKSHGPTRPWSRLDIHSSSLWENSIVDDMTYEHAR